MKDPGPPPLRCPACAAPLPHPAACPACGARFDPIAGFPHLIAPGSVVGTDRMMRWIYHRLGRLHDPAVKHLLSRLDGFDETALREGILDLLNPPPTGRLLDVGCGTGQELMRLGRRCPQAELVGVDLTPGMLSLGRENLRRAKISAWLALADVHALPFPDAQFDAVVHVGGFNNFRDRPRALAELLRVTRPGGAVVVVDERLDPTRRHGPLSLLTYAALTWYDPDRRGPEAHLPTGARYELRQLSRFYFGLRLEKPT